MRRFIYNDRFRDFIFVERPSLRYFVHFGSIFTVEIFSLHGVDSIEHSGHRVEHAGLGGGGGVLQVTTLRPEPDVDSDVGEAQEAKHKEQGLQNFVHAE